MQTKIKGLLKLQTELGGILQTEDANGIVWHWFEIEESVSRGNIECEKHWKMMTYVELEWNYGHFDDVRSQTCTIMRHILQLNDMQNVLPRVPILFQKKTHNIFKIHHFSPP